MQAWYLSEERFKNRIVKDWERNGFNYNAGNVNILRFAFRTIMYWATLNNNKVSKKNQVDIHPKLF